MFLSGLTGAGESKETGGVSLPRLTGTAASGETDDGSLLIWLIINKQFAPKHYNVKIVLYWSFIFTTFPRIEKKRRNKIPPGK